MLCYRGEGRQGERDPAAQVGIGPGRLCFVQPAEAVLVLQVEGTGQAGPNTERWRVLTNK